MLKRLLTRTWTVLLKTWSHWEEDDGFLLSAAMAYYAAFSLFPLCLVLISVLGFVMKFSAGAADAQQELLEMVGRNADPWLAGQLGALLTGVKAQAGLGGPLGFFALLFAAVVVFLQFDYMFDRIWGVTHPASPTWLAVVRSVLYDRLSAFLMLFSAGLLLVAVFLTNVVLESIIRSLVVQLPGGAAAWGWGQLGFTIGLNALLLGLIYRVLPKARVRWRDAMAGGLAVAIVWFLGQRLLVSLVIGESYTAYGVVGSFIAVMIWLYYASATVFLGAEFIQALSPHPKKSGGGEKAAGSSQ